MSTYKPPSQIRFPADKPTEKGLPKADKPRAYLRHFTVAQKGEILSDIEKVRKLLSTVTANFFTVKSGSKKLPRRLFVVVLLYINPFWIITLWVFFAKFFCRAVTDKKSAKDSQESSLASLNRLTINVPHHLDIIQLICIANLLTGFYTMGNIGCY